MSFSPGAVATVVLCKSAPMVLRLSSRSTFSTLVVRRQQRCGLWLQSTVAACFSSSFCVRNTLYAADTLRWTRIETRRDDVDFILVSSRSAAATAALMAGKCHGRHNVRRSNDTSCRPTRASCREIRRQIYVHQAVFTVRELSGSRAVNTCMPKLQYNSCYSFSSELT